MLVDLRPEDPPEIGPYRLRGRLGAGGMGVVYLGTSPLGHVRAIKVPHRHLLDDEEFRRRFTAEVGAASRVRGPGVAPVVAAEPNGDPPWLASEYVPGPPLDEALAEQPMSPTAVPRFARGLAAALASIHAAGVVHRDLKPSNIVLASNGPQVVDFGIATAGLARMTSTGVIIGSPGWIAPERIRGHDATPASDIWAWGACIAYAATGQSPFAADSHEAIAMRILLSQPDLTGLTDEVAPLVRAALATEPNDRPRADDLLDQLSNHQATGNRQLVSDYQVGGHPRREYSGDAGAKPAAVGKPRADENAIPPPRQRVEAETSPPRRRHDVRPLLIVLSLAMAAVVVIMFMSGFNFGGTPSVSPTHTPSTSPTRTPAPRPTPTPPKTATPNPPGYGEDAPTEQPDKTHEAETEVIRILNAERTANGCLPLLIDPQLASSARAHSNDMAELNYFGQFSRDGRSPDDRMQAKGYDTPAGENISQGATPQDVFDLWMNIPGYRTNILNCNIKAVGVGVTAGPPGGSPWWTADFGF